MPLLHETMTNAGSLTAWAEERVCLEFAEQSFWLACESADVLQRLMCALPRSSVRSASEPRLGLALHSADRGAFRIAAWHGKRQCNLASMFDGPEWRTFVRVPHESRVLYASTLFGPQPLVEFTGNEMVSLQEEHWGLCFLLTFNWLLLQDHRLVNLHAAVCSLNGRAIVLIGPSGAGKSTLSLALRQHGADVYGDEWAYFTVPEFRLYAWERGLCLRPGGIDALGQMQKDFSWYEAKPGDRKCAIPFEAPAMQCPQDHANLFFIQGFGGEPEIRGIRGGDAVRRLLQGMTYGRTDVMSRLEVASDLVNRFPCSLLTIGKPAATAEAVAAFLDREGV